MDRRGCRCLCNRRADLCLPAQGPLFDWSFRSAHGTAELFIRYGHTDRRLGVAVALLSAWPAGSRAVSYVRGLVVCGPLRYDPASRVPARSTRAVGYEESSGHLAPLVGSLCGFCGDIVRLLTFAQSNLHGDSGGYLFFYGLGIPNEG